MRKATRFIGLLLLVCVLTASADASVMFSDDFESGLGQWTVTTTGTGTAKIYTYPATGESVLALQGLTGSGKVVAKDTFTTPGKYQLDFDMLQVCTTDGNLRIYMPGGLVVKINAYNNGFGAYTGHDVAGETLADGTWTGEGGTTFGAWQSYTMIQDGRTAEFYKNGVLQKSWSLTADPNFTANPTIRFMGFGGNDYAHFDNVVLTPEPTTMGLLGLGGLLTLVRRKRRA